MSKFKYRIAPAAVLVLVVLTAGCALISHVPPLGHPHHATPGKEGQFIVQCKGPVASAMFDPIVYPRARMAGHTHEFYGNKSTNPSSTYASMVAAPTACDNTADTAGYWAPTLYESGVRQPVPKTTFYYIGNGGDTTPPAGLRIIAGNKAATAPQDKDVVYFGCGNGSGTSSQTTPPKCSGGDFTIHVKFPDCWNGRDLDSADHKSHMAYSPCAPSWYKIPQLVARFQWNDYHPDPSKLTLSSMSSSGKMTNFGSINTMHADWWQTWQQSRLDAIVKHCISATPHKCSADEASGF